MSWWSGRLVRLVAMAAGIAAGAYAAWRGWGWYWIAVGYLLVHTLGWALDRIRGVTRRLTQPPPTAQRYTLRTTTLSGSIVAGMGFGMLGILAVAGTFGLLGNAVARRFAAGAPLLFALGLFVVIAGGIVWLRRVVLSDVEVTVGAETLVIRVRRRRWAWQVPHPWQELRLPLSELAVVTRFRDPYGLGRWLRIDAGIHGRFELRATGLLAGRRAQSAIDGLGADLLNRLRLERGVRPYLARWGTVRYGTQPVP